MEVPFPSFHNYHEFGFPIQKVNKIDNSELIIGTKCLMMMSPFTVNKPYAGNYPFLYTHTKDIRYATGILTDASFALQLFGKKIPDDLKKEVQVLIYDSADTLYIIDGARGFASHKFKLNKKTKVRNIIGSLKCLNEFAVVAEDDIDIYKITLNGCQIIESHPIHSISICRFQKGYLASDTNGVVFIKGLSMTEYLPKGKYKCIKAIGSTIVAVEWLSLKKIILHVFEGGEDRMLGISKWIDIWDVVEDYVVAALEGNLLMVASLKDPNRKFLYNIPSFPVSSAVDMYADIGFGLDSIGISIFSQVGSLTFYIPLTSLEN